MVAILFLLYWDNLQLGQIGEIEIKFYGQALIAFAAFLTLLSMAYYLRAALPKIKAK
jgi:CDP-diacylglycerol--glycerol-3-phosphate 3-phosphatidyltransferase/cardiolipin synthase